MSASDHLHPQQFGDTQKWLESSEGQDWSRSHNYNVYNDAAQMENRGVEQNDFFSIKDDASGAARKSSFTWSPHKPVPEEWQRIVGHG